MSTDLIKPALDAGVAGLVILAAYALINRWAGRFLVAQQDQAGAMKDLAAAVREGQNGQRDILLAVRAMSSQVEVMGGWLREMREGRE